jgi:hypothetical protein
MAWKLKRANKAWQAADPTSQVFTYEELWINALTLLGGKTRDLRMSKVAAEPPLRANHPQGGLEFTTLETD